MVKLGEAIRNIKELIKAAKFESGGIVHCNCANVWAGPTTKIVCQKCGRQCNQNYRLNPGEFLVSQETSKYLLENQGLRQALSEPKGFEIQVLQRLDKLIDALTTIQDAKNGK